MVLVELPVVEACVSHADITGIVLGERLEVALAANIVALRRIEEERVL
jgi:hypothetical protein